MSFSYCNFSSFLKEKYPEFAHLLSKFCIKKDEIKCNTLIVLNKTQVSDLAKELKGLSDKDKRLKKQEISKRLRAMQLRANLRDSSFKEGIYKNNLAQNIKISAGTNGKFEIKSGAGYGKSCKVKVASDFLPDFKMGTTEEINICVAELESGEFGIDGDVGAIPQTKKTGGASMVESSDANNNYLVWKDIKQRTKSELMNAKTITDPTVHVCGLLKFILLKKREISEYSKDGKVFCQFIYENPLASLYTMFRPYSVSNDIMKRFKKEWCYAPYVCNDTSALLTEYCNEFCDKQSGSCEQKLAEIKSTDDITRVDLVIDLYKEMYPNWDEKLWADEVAFYIDSQMEKLIASKSGKEFSDFCKSLKAMYPGNEYAAESLILNSNQWKGMNAEQNMQKLDRFINSPFFACAAITNFSDKYVGSGLTKSTYLTNLIMMNQ